MSNNKPSPEELHDMVFLIRSLVGDLEGSIFYPVLSDEEIIRILKFENYHVMRAARRVAMGVGFYLTTSTYKERTGEIEVINNASIQYGKLLRDFLDDSKDAVLPDDLIPYAGGISVRDRCQYINNPDSYVNPLARISPCLAWWTKVKGLSDCEGGGFSGGCNSRSI